MRITSCQLRKIIREQIDNASRGFNTDGEVSYEAGWIDALANRPMKPDNDESVPEKDYQQYMWGYNDAEAETNRQLESERLRRERDNF